jgi:hypothetical protein
MLRKAKRYSRSSLAFLGCVLLAVVGFVGCVFVAPAFNPRLKARTHAFRHAEPWIAAVVWGAALVLFYLAGAGHFDDLPVAVASLSPPVAQPTSAAAVPAPAPAPSHKPVTGRAPVQRPTSSAPSAAPPSPSPSPATRLTVRITRSSYGYVAARTLPGARCGVKVVLPNGNPASGASLATSKTASTTGSVSWSYERTLTDPGQGKSTVTCALSGQTASASAAFSVAAPSPAPSGSPGA